MWCLPETELYASSEHLGCPPHRYTATITALVEADLRVLLLIIPTLVPLLEALPPSPPNSPPRESRMHLLIFTQRRVPPNHQRFSSFMCQQPGDDAVTLGVGNE